MGTRPPFRLPTGPRGAELRIIGGRLRGRPVRYNGDPATRPMKERVREAVFNLIGPSARGKRVIDLFSGTGAMAFEAISRGGESAVVVERRFPNARTIRENAAALGLENDVRVVAGDAFVWTRREFEPGEAPLLVFCCPPYDFFLDRRSDLLELIQTYVDRAPRESLLVVECDTRFEPGLLPLAEQWDVRRYPPAVVALLEIPPSDPP